MIERFYLKDYLSFKEVELELKSGLVVFTGPSGSGKSILMGSILSSFGSTSCEASLCESSVAWELNGEEYGIESDDINVFKHIKKEKSRYFINNQSISKKAMSELSSNYLRHLSLRDFSDFDNENLLNIIDSRMGLKNAEIQRVKSEYKELFLEHKRVKKELLSIEDEQKKIVELKEFASYEIKKIDTINPKISEDIELLEIKKELSKKEKVLKSLSSADAIFEHEHAVFSALDLLDKDGSFFSDAMNELRALLESAQERFSMLEEIDVEEVLNRIEELGELKRRYGSIEEALIYKQEKIQELQKYENIEFTKGDLEARVKELDKQVVDLASKLSLARYSEIDSFNKELNKYLKDLYLRDALVEINESEFSAFGKDEITIKLNSTDLQKISTGEFNRLRLAILALKSETMSKDGGVLILDEIDANLSGEESMSVAKVLKQLSKHFQIFVISHQPQLTSMGDQHFLVYKEGDESLVKELDFERRVEEIARIISGESITQEARGFAKELLNLQIRE
ncbi:ATPase [Sulfurimonas denitrificans DSM 1251]|uniref:DNA repair protein RecN n=1 Tax=Sulfurimonas denitrificans (strain ATCC 33889 / DSM 1251) TaxID=326298 RepID=Q30RL9_SULDN|nr:AAA family ATPase [Sulfurimonas denitrificans]ABB44362.1 ATPase [Sulfurimonas denitrificans DSM 1251]MDD3441943.1 AAA family ATPase [Sulfurimonas denitrificans]